MDELEDGLLHLPPMLDVSNFDMQDLEETYNFF